MTTEVVAVDPDRPDPTILDRAAAILRSGGLVAFGTETVYGLGADATNPEAVARIFAAKGRPSTNPLIVHVADAEEWFNVGGLWPNAAEILADRFWPGPLTLVLPRPIRIPTVVSAGLGTVGVRSPAATVARELIRRAGIPIAAPSANLANRISPTRAEHVRKDLDGRVDLILDSGPCTVGIESTVLDLAGFTYRILRPGPIGLDEIALALSQDVERFTGVASPDHAASSPGQLAVHYAPITPAYRIGWAELERFQPNPATTFSLITLGPRAVDFRPPRAWSVNTHRLLRGPVSAAAGLYETLHELDAERLEFVEGTRLGFLLLITPPDDEPGWEAVLDRVRRATRLWGDAGPPG